MIILSAAHFEKVFKIARRELEAMMATLGRIEGEYDLDGMSTLLVKKKLMHKWYLNLLATMLLFGDEQRPQVYGQLQTPSLKRWNQ